MRFGKRSLAGVAAGALALGMLTIASAPAASAKASAKPKAAVNAVTATVGPVRYSTTASIQDAVYTSPLLFAAPGSGDDSRVGFDDTIVVTLLTAPSNSARMWLDSAGEIVPVNAALTDDTLTLAQPSRDDTFAPGGTNAFNLYRFGTASPDDTVVQTTVGVSEAGTYSGRIDIYKGNRARTNPTNIIESVTFTFTTVGKPATLSLSPTSVALSASTSSTARVTATLADASANITQPGAYDNLLITSANAAIATTTPASGTNLSALAFDDSSLTVLGVPTITITGNTTAGNTTVTAAPLGTLPSNGITTQTVAVTSGSTASLSPRTLLVTAPTTQIIPLDDSGTGSDDTAYYTANVNLVRSLTVTGTASTPNAGVAGIVTCSGSFTGLAVGGIPIANCNSAVTVLATADAAGTTNWVGSWTTATPGSWIRVQVAGQGGRTTKAVQVQLVNPTPFPLSSPSGAIVQKTGQASTFAVSITDDFGNPYVGYGVQGRATGTTATGAFSTRVTTNAAGEATISVPAPSATYTGAASMAFTVTSPGGAAEPTLAPRAVTITYSASGDVTALSVAPVTTAASTVTNLSTSQAILPLISIPSTQTGLVGTALTPGTFTVATATAAGAPTPLVEIRPTSTPANAVTVTAPAGVKVSNLPTSIATNYASGSQTALISNGDSVYVWATKTGTHDLTFTSGTMSVTYKIRVVNSSNDAYNIDLTPQTQNMAAGSFATAKLTVTDAFGNPVDTTDDTGLVTITATGEVRLSGLASSQNVTTNAAGEASITLVAGTATGNGAIAAVPATGNRAFAWATGYVRPTGYPAPIVSDTSEVKVTASPSVKSISIIGERATVSGRPGIRVEGTAVGFATGDAVKPWVRFPGQSSYSAGSARPTISAVGDFTWQRKTGKKTYVYFSSADDVVKSNRVIIAAN